MAIGQRGRSITKTVYVPLGDLPELDRAVDRSGVGFSSYALAALMRQVERDNAKADKESDERLTDAAQADELSRAAGL
jgi:hypothetical protein